MVVAQSSAGTLYIRPMFQLKPLLMVHQVTGLDETYVSNKRTNKKNGKNKLKLNVKECAHFLTPNESLNKVY